MQAVTGRVIAGRYQLLSCVGQGAMGTVWRASDPVLGREVAVKEIRLPGLMPEQERHVLRERTLREARVAAKLSHPAVVTVYDVVEADGNPWIVMEYVAARSLQRVLDEDGALPAPRVAAIGATLLDALASAHAVGVVHRDVKPANVLIASGDRAVLTDFGIATLEGDPGLTQAGMVMGTPGFCAPERIRGEPASPASDLWSLGATLYAAVQGHAPFQSQESPMAVLALIANSDPPLAAAAGPLSPVISALMSRDPRGRPDAASAQRMLDQARRALSDARPAIAAPPTTHTAAHPAAPGAAHPAAHTAGTGAHAGRTAAHAGPAAAQIGSAGAAVGGASCGAGEETRTTRAGTTAGAPSGVAWTWPPRDVPDNPRSAGLDGAGAAAAFARTAPPRDVPDGPRSAGLDGAGAAAAFARTAPLPVIPSPPRLAAGAPRFPSHRAAAPARRPTMADHRRGSPADVGAVRACGAPGGAAATPAAARTGRPPEATSRRPPRRSRRRTLVLVSGLAIVGLGVLALGLMAHAARVARLGSGALAGRPGPAASLPSSYRWYSAPAGTPLAGLSLAVPRDWLVARNGARIVASDRATGSAIMVAPVPSGAVGPVRSMLLLSRQVRDGAFPGFHRVAAGSLLVRGAAADSLTFTYLQPGRGTMKGLAVMLSSPGPADGTGYEFLASAPLSHWPAARAALAEALRTFVVGG